MKKRILLIILLSIFVFTTSFSLASSFPQSASFAKAKKYKVSPSNALSVKAGYVSIKVTSDKKYYGNKKRVYIYNSKKKFLKSSGKFKKSATIKGLTEGTTYYVCVAKAKKYCKKKNLVETYTNVNFTIKAGYASLKITSSSEASKKSKRVYLYDSQKNYLRASSKFTKSITVENLNDGTPYYVSVAKSKKYSIKLKKAYTNLYVPKAVSSFTPVIGSSQIVLNWNDAKYATRYYMKILDSLDGDTLESFYTDAPSLTLTNAWFDSYGIESGDMFFFRVQSQRLKGSFEEKSSGVNYACARPFDQSGKTKALDLNVASFNILGSASAAGKGKATLAQRVPQIANIAKSHNLDILATQEFSAVETSAMDSLKAITGLDVVSDLSTTLQVFYNPAKFNVATVQSLQLYDSSYDADKDSSRFIKVVLFEDINNSGNRFYVVNAHLSNQSWIEYREERRKWEIRKLMGSVQSINSENLPVILMGDLNMSNLEWDKGGCQLLNNNYNLVDSDLAANSKINYQYRSFHNYETRPNDQARIDHIFIDDNFTSNIFSVAADAIASYPSDHFMVYAQLSLFN
jgi:endonuclease/exonuclease/phosphatase family metal-dependent hydrolase